MSLVFFSRVVFYPVLLCFQGVVLPFQSGYQIRETWIHSWSLLSVCSEMFRVSDSWRSHSRTTIIVACTDFTRGHFGVPHELISDRGSHFRAEVDTLLQRYGVQHHRSSAYKPPTNGAVEAANKNIKRILRKMVETSRDWSEKIPFALWAYRTLLSHLYRSHTLFSSIWYGGSFAH